MEIFECWNIKNLDCRSVYISHNLLFNWYIQTEEKVKALSTKLFVHTSTNKYLFRNENFRTIILKYAILRILDNVPFVH